METGILNNKGRVHFTLTSPINDQLAQLIRMEKNELIAAIASIIDKEIYQALSVFIPATMLPMIC